MTVEPHRLVRLALANWNEPDSDYKHFSFIVWRGGVLSMGWNHGYKTHPIAAQYGHLFDSIHSELDAIRHAPIYPRYFPRHTMINLRLRHNGALAMAKPCEPCQKMLKDFGFKNVVYSTNDGEFVSL